MSPEISERSFEDAIECALLQFGPNACAGEANDLTGWLEFFTAGLATQLDEVKARGERTIRRDVLVRQHGLSDRQALALGLAIEHERLSIQDFEALCPGATRRTLQRDLEAMVEKGLLVERGAGPTDPTRHDRLAEAVLEPRTER